MKCPCRLPIPGMHVVRAPEKARRSCRGGIALRRKPALREKVRPLGLVPQWCRPVRNLGRWMTMDIEEKWDSLWGGSKCLRERQFGGEKEKEVKRKFKEERG